MRRISIYIILALCLVLAIALLTRASPGEYLNNPSFTGGITGWTVSTTSGTLEYDASWFKDSEGSLKGATAAGKKATMVGYAWQTVTATIDASDTVELRLWWSKQAVVGASRVHIIRAEMERPITPGWVELWSEINTIAAGDPSAFADTGTMDKSVLFDETGIYKFRWYFSMESANAVGAVALSWVDDTHLEVREVATVISIAVEDGVINYGIVALSGSKDTTAFDTQYAGNTGNVTEDFNITGFDSAAWQLSTAGVSSNVYMHKFATDGGTNWTAFGSQDYTALVPDVSVNTSKDFDLKIWMPTVDSSSGATQDVNVTIQAVQG